MKHKEYIRLCNGADTAVLLVHGIVSSPRHFEWLISHIPQTVSVCNLLLDGHGGSVNDFSKTSMRKWQQQVDDQLATLSQTHNHIVIVGYSLGTLLTMSLAEKYPNIKGLLLLNPPLRAKIAPIMAWRSLKFCFGRVNKNDPMELSCYDDISVTLEPWLWKYAMWIPHFLSLLQLSKQCRPIAERLTVPCYALLGGRDELVRRTTQRHLHNNPHIRCKMFEQSGHCYYEPAFKEYAADCLAQMLAVK